MSHVAIDEQELQQVLAVGAASHDGLVTNAILPEGRDLNARHPVKLEALQFAQAAALLEQLGQLLQVLLGHRHHDQLDGAQIGCHAKNLNQQPRLHEDRVRTANVKSLQISQSVRAQRRLTLRTVTGGHVQLAEIRTRVQQPVQPRDFAEADTQRAQLLSHAVSDDVHQIVFVREVHVELGQIGEAVRGKLVLFKVGVVQVQHAHFGQRNVRGEGVE